MWFVIVLIVVVSGVVLLAVRLAWAMILLLPYYGVIGIVVYIFWRLEKLSAERARRREKEDEFERQMNQREYAAWMGSIDRSPTDRQPPK